MLGSFTTVGPVFGGPVWNPDAGAALELPCDVCDELQLILDCCNSLVSSVSNLLITNNANLDKAHADHLFLCKLIKRIFSDQRNQSQLIEGVTRGMVEIQKKLGIKSAITRLKPRGDSRYGNTD